MTRRIAIAILLTTWAALLAIGAAVYVATRHVMLSDLDGSIVARASALPERLGVAGSPAGATTPQGDRFVIKDATGRTIARPTALLATAPPIVIDRRFATTGDGERQRTLTLSITPAADTSGEPVKPITVTYSTSAERFDRLLTQLIWWLIGATAACGVASAGAAVLVSRLALRPLRRTAEQIGEIDERSLDRRIDIAALPAELVPTGRRLNEMLARLESAFDQRTRFLSDASHELRTPVAAIMTTIEVALRRPRDPAALMQTLGACLSDATALRELVDRLMQQVRSETPSLAEPAQQFDLVDLLNGCADSVTRSRDGKARIRCHLPQSLPVVTEPCRLRSIVGNLLSNAVEYNQDDGTVDLTCEADDGVVITVSDTGPGIPPAVLPRLFQPFSRGNESRNGERHLGLGLSIVQAHVLALGGRCEADSPPGQGATFRVRLPASVLVKNVCATAVI